MGIAVSAPRGGLAEPLAGQRRPFLLTNAEIERFEDAHMGIFDAWEGFMGRAPRLNSTQVRDLAALGLVGGGMEDEEADTLVSGLGPEHLMALYTIGQALIGVAFFPDTVDGGGDEGDGQPDEGDEKKT